jgi:hypothetical protein
LAYLNDSRHLKADVYAIYFRLMRLGVKQLYVEMPKRVVKGKTVVEDSEVFFKPTIEVT